MEDNNVVTGMFQREDYSSTCSFARGRAQLKGMWPVPSSGLPPKDDDTKSFHHFESQHRNNYDNNNKRGEGKGKGHPQN